MHSVNHAELTVIFATADHIPALLKLAPRIPKVKMIVAMDEVSPESKKILVEWGQERNIQVKDLPECMSLFILRSHDAHAQ